MPGGEVVRAAGEKVQAMTEPVQQRLRRKEAEARSRQLDGQRHAVEPLADLDNCLVILGCQLESCFHRARSFDEQHYGFGLTLRHRR